MDRVKGKIALVTGGAMGLGQATSQRLAEEGATVVITDIADERGRETVHQINTSGGRAIYIHHDVTQESEWKSVITQIVQTFGGLHILVNNAGIAVPCEITSMSLEDFHRQNAVNLDGVFLGLKHGIPAIANSGGGSVINLSSVAGLKGAPGLAAYSMTKGGICLLSKSVALECIKAKNGVRVNSIHPGLIETSIWDTADKENIEENRKKIKEFAAKIIPGGVIGKAIDIANGILFLASEESNYMTGSELVMDHGLST